MGKVYRWNIRPRFWDANVVCVGRTYLDLFSMKKDQDDRNDRLLPQCIF